VGREDPWDAPCHLCHRACGSDAAAPAVTPGTRAGLVRPPGAPPRRGARPASARMRLPSGAGSHRARPPGARSSAGSAAGPGTCAARPGGWCRPPGASTPAPAGRRAPARARGARSAPGCLGKLAAWESWLLGKAGCLRKPNAVGEALGAAVECGQRPRPRQACDARPRALALRARGAGGLLARAAAPAEVMHAERRDVVYLRVMPVPGHVHVVIRSDTKTPPPPQRTIAPLGRWPSALSRLCMTAWTSPGTGATYK